MTLPPVVRVFFAIDLSSDIKEKIGGFIGSLKKQAKSNAIRWTKPENLHITLQFLAEVRSEHLPQLLDQVRKKLAGTAKPQVLSFGEIHLFPNPFRPRVMVLEVMEQAELAKLSGLIGEGIVAAEYAIEDRPFRAHLTLGRIKHPEMDLHFLNELPTLKLDQINITEVVLFRSEPQQDGSIYMPIERIKL
ncbi:MAG: 2'-5' RNA ligase [uncultured bacterium]|nr:MAG: 2'-5' RNA ligase [uncultured bacterium]